MNDLEKAAEKFKDWEDVRAEREVKRVVKEAKTGPKIDHLRADQYQMLWKAIARVGFEFQGRMYSGDGKHEKMYTEMANAAADVMMKVTRNPKLRMRGKEAKRVGK